MAKKIVAAVQQLFAGGGGRRVESLVGPEDLRALARRRESKKSCLAKRDGL